MRNRNLAFTATVASMVALLGACSSNSGKQVTAHSTAPLSPTTTTVAASSSAPTSRKPTTTTSPPRDATAADLAAVRVRLQTIVSGLSSPVDVVFRPGTNQMYAVEQTGLLRAVTNGRAASSPALDLTGNLSHGNEQGFLSAAFSPDGTRLYVDYTDRNGDTNVDEYTMRGNTVDARTRRRVMLVQQPFANHNGGEVVFGPDGMLYVGLGDGGSEDDPRAYGQNLATPLAKILRIDPTQVGTAAYTIPNDNPFATRAGAFRETWMYGLRNPWRFSFDRATGDVWIGDVGQNKYEEIDFAGNGNGSGANWGWSRREGFHAFTGTAPAGARDPIVEEPHSAGWCAIVGGYVYRGRAIPALDGVYLFGDDCHSGIEGLTARNGRSLSQRALGIGVDELTSFGQDDNGELYLVSRRGTISNVVSG